MTQTTIHKSTATLKSVLPLWLWNPIRSVGTAVLGPILFAHRTGYWRSALKRAAVSRANKPLPWYTYPAIDFLKFRSYESRVVLEFGGGQSTLWWAERAKHVVTLEGDKDWFEKIKSGMPGNVDLSHVSMANAQANVAAVNAALAEKAFATYDVIVIDGLYRAEMIEIAVSKLSADGIIICDNAEGYGFFEGFQTRGLARVDFFGNAPGVVLPHCTCLYFTPAAFVFAPTYPIPVIANVSD